MQAGGGATDAGPTDAASDAPNDAILGLGVQDAEPSDSGGGG